MFLGGITGLIMDGLVSLTLLPLLIWLLQSQIMYVLWGGRDPLSPTGAFYYALGLSRVIESGIAKVLGGAVPRLDSRPFMISWFLSAALLTSGIVLLRYFGDRNPLPGDVYAFSIAEYIEADQSVGGARVTYRPVEHACIALNPAEVSEAWQSSAGFVWRRDDSLLLIHSPDQNTTFQYMDLNMDRCSTVYAEASALAQTASRVVTSPDEIVAAPPFDYLTELGRPPTP